MSEVIILERNDDLKTLLSCFSHNSISHVPIVEEGRLIGMVSKTDVTDFLARKEVQDRNESFSELLKNVKVKEVMIQPVVKAEVTESRKELLGKLVDHQVGSVVLTQDGRVAGIVTEKDLLQYFDASFGDEEESATESFISQVNAWMHNHGVTHISKALSDIGI